jgi:hypothetical protein
MVLDLNSNKKRATTTAGSFAHPPLLPISHFQIPSKTKSTALHLDRDAPPSFSGKIFSFLFLKLITEKSL